MIVKLGRVVFLTVQQSVVYFPFSTKLMSDRLAFFQRSLTSRSQLFKLLSVLIVANCL
ncbi:hypothetical protein IQ255_29650 [Pleurocapsales cyanobacterium LEGE 10410]|nr:hypothetical protein [Pleurocapsales cyanobacterium LEGE 10410]